MEEMILINSFDTEIAFGVLRINSRNRKSHHGSHLTQGTLTLLISGRAVSLPAVFPRDPGLATAPVFVMGVYYCKLRQRFQVTENTRAHHANTWGNAVGHERAPQRSSTEG